MTSCRPCREFLQRHPKAARRAAFFIGLALFFFWLGRVSGSLAQPGLCQVYFS